MKAQARTATRELSTSTEQYLCPDCSGVMTEVDRINEKGFSFIWYECKRSGCDGQWLEKSRLNEGNL